MPINAAELEFRVQQSLANYGLATLGWFRSDDGKAGLLLGNRGGGMWPAFRASGLMDDGAPDPLNRWTRRVLDPLAGELGCEVRYPFGEPVWPFLSWAQKATGAQPSPLFMLIDRQVGLWWALRGALMFEDVKVAAASTQTEQEAPCVTCATKPCLTACPVDAFSESDYNVAACRAHVASAEGEMCRTQGCLARRACPIGKGFQYSAEQQAFHMAQFLGS